MPRACVGFFATISFRRLSAFVPCQQILPMLSEPLSFLTTVVYVPSFVIIMSVDALTIRLKVVAEALRGRVVSRSMIAATSEKRRISLFFNGFNPLFIVLT